MIGLFVLLLCYFVIPFSLTLKRSFFPAAAGIALIFFILGGVLIYLTLKFKVKGKLKLFLLFTGIAALGFLISVLLHNLVYGLFIYFFGEGFWGSIGMDDEPFFFFIALLGCPVLFLVGIVGALVMFFKKK